MVSHSLRVSLLVMVVAVVVVVIYDDINNLTQCELLDIQYDSAQWMELQLCCGSIQEYSFTVSSERVGF